MHFFSKNKSLYETLLVLLNSVLHTFQIPFSFAVLTRQGFALLIQNENLENESSSYVTKLFHLLHVIVAKALLNSEIFSG